MLNTNELDYELPESAIARTAAEPRDSSKLLVVRRSDPSYVEHRRVSDLPDLLQPHDLMVVNTTRVLPARLMGYRADTGGGVEGLFLGLAGEGVNERQWKVLLRGRRMKPGITINLLTSTG
ncbi:MAG TPA: S-adenosylmethionine:tRNA ribosyltransferase-isomerase, partial [Phycisphaerales bacterium]|nr:S-adenosylmethionine:tRNA ribosyltransferase-isomerase [Phycisphaerales bacterium]